MPCNGEEPDAAVEIEDRLKQHGSDADAVNAEVYLLARDQLETFDDLIQRAQYRRITLLREISVRREFAKRAAGISEAVIEAKFLRGPKVRFKYRIDPLGEF